MLAGGLESPETVARLQATCGEGGDGLHWCRRALRALPGCAGLCRGQRASGVPRGLVGQDVSTERLFFLGLRLLCSYSIIVTSNKMNDNSFMLSNTSPYANFPFVSKTMFL